MIILSSVIVLVSEIILILIASFHLVLLDYLKCSVCSASTSRYSSLEGEALKSNHFRFSKFEVFFVCDFESTRSYAALRAADLDWIVFWIILLPNNIMFYPIITTLDRRGAGQE